MKNIFSLLIFFISYSSFAQTTGIVSNINPQMGYIYLKGAFNPKALHENDLNYSFSDSIATYLEDRNITTKILDSFDFAELEYFSERIKYKKMVAYAEDFCQKNNLDRIIIVRKKNAYTISDPMQMFDGFIHDYGIATLSIYDKTAMLFYNFSIIGFTKGEKDFRIFMGPNYKSHKFEDILFDKVKYTLINKNVEPFFKNLFKDKLMKGLEKLDK